MSLDMTLSASRRRLRLFQAGLMEVKMQGVGSKAAYQPTPKPSPFNGPAVMRSRLSQLCWMIEWLGRVSRSASRTGSFPMYTRNLHIFFCLYAPNSLF